MKRLSKTVVKRVNVKSNYLLKFLKLFIFPLQKNIGVDGIKQS